MAAESKSADRRIILSPSDRFIGVMSLLFALILPLIALQSTDGNSDCLCSLQLINSIALLIHKGQLSPCKACFFQNLLFLLLALRLLVMIVTCLNLRVFRHYKSERGAKLIFLKRILIFPAVAVPGLLLSVFSTDKFVGDMRLMLLVMHGLSLSIFFLTEWLMTMFVYLNVASPKASA